MLTRQELRPVILDDIDPLENRPTHWTRSLGQEKCTCSIPTLLWFVIESSWKTHHMQGCGSHVEAIVCATPQEDQRERV